MNTQPIVYWIGLLLLTAVAPVRSEQPGAESYPEELFTGGDYYSEYYVGEYAEPTGKETGHSGSSAVPSGTGINVGVPDYSFNLGSPQGGTGSTPHVPGDRGDIRRSPPSRGQASLILEESKMILQSIADKADESGRELMASCRGALDRIAEYIARMPVQENPSQDEAMLRETDPAEFRSVSDDPEAVEVGSSPLRPADEPVPMRKEDPRTEVSTDDGLSEPEERSDGVAERLRALASELERLAREVDHDG